MNEKNVGEVADNIVIFFRAKALSRNSFISTNPYKFAVKNKGSQIGYGQQKRGKQDAFGKTWERNGRRKRMKLKRTLSANGTGCRE